MLTVENWKRLEDTLTDYVCGEYENDGKLNTEEIRIAVDMLKALHASNWQVGEDEPDTDSEEDIERGFKAILEGAKEALGRINTEIDKAAKKRAN